MKELFDDVSVACSRLTTRSYSTSFSLGVRLLDKRFRDPIYSVYGFVRFADEIVDTFHDFDKRELLNQFRDDTWDAIEKGISLNPILNSYQAVVNRYNIERELTETFLNSMEMDLTDRVYDKDEYDTYILGSAEVVGLMCLRIFTDGDTDQYNALKPSAMKLGSAFQKVNFLRDLKADFAGLGRTYFPGVEVNEFDESMKRAIEAEIDQEFAEALEGIKRLPKGARLGVYLAFVYYQSLFKKIRSVPSSRIMEERIRIPNQRKMALLLGSYVRHQFNAI